MRTLASLFLLAASLSFAVPARADIPPPEVESCSGKADGDTCEIGGDTLTCKTKTCSRYNPDDPANPTQYECVACEGPAPEDSGCSVRHRAATGAAGAWALGAAVMWISRRRSPKTR